MKKMWVLTLILLSVNFCFASFPKSSPANRADQSVNVQSQQNMSLLDLKQMTVKQYEQRIGRKLSLREKLDFALLKHHLLRVGDTGKGTLGSAIGGFFLGLLIPGIGLLIAYLLPKNITLRNWALIGTGVAVLIIIFLIAIGSAFGDWN